MPVEIGQIPIINDSRQLINVSNLAGMVAYFGINVAPTGWLKANGAAISRTTFSDLFIAIGTTWGVGDGFTTFNIPDLRGTFIRSWDDGRGLDPGRFIASYQADSNKAHVHTHSITGQNNYVAFPGGGQNMQASGAPGFAIGGGMNAEGGAQAQPRNYALLACIKY